MNTAKVFNSETELIKAIKAAFKESGFGNFWYKLISVDKIHIDYFLEEQGFEKIIEKTPRNTWAVFFKKGFKFHISYDIKKPKYFTISFNELIVNGDTIEK